MTATTIRDAFAKQEGWCRLLGADFTAGLCQVLGTILDRTTEVGRRVLDWPGDTATDALVLRLTGGLNALVRDGSLPALAALYPPAAFDRGAIETPLRAALAHAVLAAWLDGPPQTNEVGRAAVLMPGLMTIAAETGLPLALFELGASAGLNLRLDTYAYDFVGLHVGPADATVRLAPHWEGPRPLAAEVAVTARRGVDLNPIDVTSDAGRARLLAYVWPEQAARIDRLAAALAAAALNPPIVDRADAAAWVEQRIAPRAGVATVVYHSIAFQYFPAVSRDRIATHLAAMGAVATAAAPLAWLRFEQEGGESGVPPTLRLRLWPGGERLLAEAHPHGTSVRWFG